MTKILVNLYMEVSIKEQRSRAPLNMYEFIKIRHDIIKQCHWSYKEMKKFNYKLEIEIFRNSRLGCPKRHPDALLAKTMVCGVHSSYLDKD